MELLEKTAELNLLIEACKDSDKHGRSPVEDLNKISSLLEQEAAAFALLDPDPFDAQVYARAEPDCIVGHLLKMLYEDDNFLNKVLTSYLFNADNNFDLNVAAARLVLNMPTLDGSDLFQDFENDVGKLFKWAKDEKEPLRTFATGHLATAMHLSEGPSLFKEQNAVLVPIVMKRLKVLAEMQDVNCAAVSEFKSVSGKSRFLKAASSKSRRKSEATGRSDCVQEKMDVDHGLGCGYGNGMIESSPAESNVPRVPPVTPKAGTSVMAVTSAMSSGSRRKRHHPTAKRRAYEYSKSSFSLEPLTVGIQQRCILRYLHSMGAYQEILPLALEHNFIELVLHYINVKVQPDAELACSALLALSSFLCHKKFISEFVAHGGIHRILEIPQPSIVATMSSLCVFYLAYSEDAVERICLFPDQTLQKLVEYELWLLECAHVSGRNHSALFFSLTFAFRAVLELFNSMDGFRKVVNMISTLKIMCVEEAVLTSDEEVFTDRETAKNACNTLELYFAANVAIVGDECRRIAARSHGGHPPTPVPHYKALPAISENMLENVDLLLSSQFRSVWLQQFVKKTISLNVPGLLLQLIAFAADWKNYSNRTDLILSAMSCLAALSVSPQVQLLFCNAVEVRPNDFQSGMKILVRAAEGDLVQDVAVQKSALQVLCNCVSSTENKRVKPLPSASKGKSTAESISNKMREAVRLRNGIKVLLALVNVKTPIVEADSIRALAMRVLCGLSLSERICQVLGKLPLFHNEQLQLMMREPVLPDNAAEHQKFCKHASELIQRVTGKSLLVNGDSSVPIFTRLSKADIVAQTRITYPSKELLVIIHNHLKSQGLHRTAEALQCEASLPVAAVDDHVRALAEPTPNALASPSLSRKVAITPMRSGNASINSVSRTLDSDRRASKFGKFAARPAPSSSAVNPTSLDEIVTQYLRERHAHCQNPVSTCPPFSLLRPHHCPEPRYRKHAPVSIARRMISRQSHPSHGGLLGAKYNRKYLYSKFRSTGFIKDADGDSVFTCCSWIQPQRIVLGTQMGEVRVYYNYDYGQEEAVQSCHPAPISTIQVSKDGKLMTTSAPYGIPMGAVWTISDETPVTFEMKFQLPEDNFVQFSHSEERVVGTDNVIAHVYDLNSGRLMDTYFDPRNANHYIKNFACFGHGDDLLLNDGCLWDVRAKKLIHKFDKFNDYVSGVFHPSGLEIIINSEVWDVRTFHLLDTCPSLDQCRVIFSQAGDVVYGVRHVSNDREILTEQAGMLGPYDSSFRTFDAFDFSAIGTLDVKKSIFDLKPNPLDTVLAVIENNVNAKTLDVDTTCRFYDIGRLKRMGEEESDEDQEEEEAPADGDEDEDDEDEMVNLLEDFLQDDDDGDDRTFDLDGNSTDLESADDDSDSDESTSGSENDDADENEDDDDDGDDD